MAVAFARHGDPPPPPPSPPPSPPRAPPPVPPRANTGAAEASHDGVLAVRSDAKQYRGCLLKLKEEGGHTLLFTAFDTESGKPVVTEATTLLSDFSRRVRTAQRFDKSGKLIAVYCSREEKYLDEQSGAVDFTL